MVEDSGKVLVRIDSDLEEIVPGYLENRRGDVARLQSMLEQESFESLLSLGHRMKGSGAGYGFDAITDFGRAIERAAMERDRDVMEQLIAELSSYLECVEVTYE